MTQSHVDRLRRMYDGFASGDFAPFLELMHDDVQWHLHGDGPYGGTTDGRDALVRRLLAQSEASGGTATIEWRGAMATDDSVIVLERLRAARTGQALDMPAVVVYRFVGNQVVEAWDVFDDQRGYDEFWS